MTICNILIQNTCCLSSINLMLQCIKLCRNIISLSHFLTILKPLELASVTKMLTRAMQYKRTYFLQFQYKSKEITKSQKFKKEKRIEESPSTLEKYQTCPQYVRSLTGPCTVCVLHHQCCILSA